MEDRVVAVHGLISISLANICSVLRRGLTTPNFAGRRGVEGEHDRSVPTCSSKAAGLPPLASAHIGTPAYDADCLEAATGQD